MDFIPNQYNPHNLIIDFHSQSRRFFSVAVSFPIIAGGRHESQDLAWHAVASWTWDAQDETCGICRMPFDGCCPDCKLPGDDCPLIWGACNHSFHLHCILKWVNSQTSQAHCPMCRREWQFKE
ncbi:anaphase-promoting complex subunit 11-like [Brassica napus]|uniref:anaphase-promoting complex subunit 11-like n=1 Tax=Brassica napus TaxID=3708 RepID=UPI000BBF1A38|nr:anaphase-promoting complex subunit 11-like [Brassica napus]